MKKMLMSIVVIAIISCGCNKTEQTLKKIYGEYTLKTYTVNGVDSLSLYKDSLGSNFDFHYDNVNNNKYLTITGSRSDGKTTSMSSIWSLQNKGKVIKILTTYGEIGVGAFGADKKPEWEILSLKNEFKMKTIYNEKEYFVEIE